MHSKIFKFFLLECIQGTKVTLVLRVQRRTLFLSMSNVPTLDMSRFGKSLTMQKRALGSLLNNLRI